MQSLYQLPETYGETKIALLAINPYQLYAYWEISGEKLKSFAKNVEPQIMETSVPALKVTNISRNTFELIRINDHSTSWYINVPDSGCIYMAEIGRNLLDEFFISFASSNHVVTPNASISLNDTVCLVNFYDISKVSMVSLVSNDSKAIKINIPGKIKGVPAPAFYPPLGFLEQPVSSIGFFDTQ